MVFIGKVYNGKLCLCIRHDNKRVFLGFSVPKTKISL